MNRNYIDFHKWLFRQGVSSLLCPIAGMSLIAAIACAVAAFASGSVEQRDWFARHTFSLGVVFAIASVSSIALSGDD